jgi:prepilin-type N-terminal cleavage/methylation domain-containing protein
MHLKRKALSAGLLRWARGVTLIELGIAIVIIGIFTAFAIVSFERTYEDRDGRALEAAMATYQNVVTQGATRLNVTPSGVNPAMVLQAMPPTKRLLWETAGQNITVYTLAVKNQPKAQARSIRFRTNSCGDVCANRLSGFTHYLIKPGGTTCQRDPVETSCRYIAPVS